MNNEEEKVLELVEDLRRKRLNYSVIAEKHGIHEHYFTVEFMDYTENFSFFNYQKVPSEEWKQEKENFLLSLFGRAAKSISYHSSK